MKENFSQAETDVVGSYQTRQTVALRRGSYSSWIWLSLVRTLAGVCLSLRLHPAGDSIRAPTGRRLALAVAPEIERGTSVGKVLAGDEPMMEHEWRSA